MLRGILVVLLVVAGLSSLLVAVATGALLGQRVPFLDGTPLEGSGLERWVLAFLFIAFGGLHCLLPSRAATLARDSDRALLWLLWLYLALVLTSTEAATALLQPGLNGPSWWHFMVLLAMLAAIGVAPAGIVLSRSRNNNVSCVSNNETAQSRSVSAYTPPASAEALFRLIAFQSRSDFPGVLLQPDGRIRTSARAVAEAIGCSRTTAWRNLKLLVEFDCVELRSDRHGTTVTLLGHPLWRKSRGPSGHKLPQGRAGTGATQFETSPNHDEVGTGIKPRTNPGTETRGLSTASATGHTRGDSTAMSTTADTPPAAPEIAKTSPETARNTPETSLKHHGAGIGARDRHERGIDACFVSGSRSQAGSPASDGHLALIHAFENDWSDAESAEWAFNPDLRILLPFDFGETGPGRRADATRRTATALVANMVASLQRGSSGCVHYSRDRNRYCRGRYQPRWLTLGTVRKAVDWLALNDLIIEERAQASPRQRRRSIICPAPLLIERLGDLRSCPIFVEPAELIQLRDDTKKPKDYVDDPDTMAMRSDVREHNAMLATVAVDPLDERAERIAPNLLRFSGAIYSLRTTYRRIFNMDFQTGGRCYADIQNMPKSLRPALTINGERTIEYDYRACHYRLLSALAKLPFDKRSQAADPFALPGQDRRRIKLAFNTFLNAPTTQSAALALSADLRDQGISDPGRVARRTLNAVTNAFPHFTGYWGKGFGLRLQHHDAMICSIVQRKMRERNIAVISIHDSFVASARYDKILEQIALAVFEEHCDKLRRA